MSLTNSDVAWIANNVEEWKEAYDRVCVFLDGGVEFFNSKYFPGKEGLNREEWQASRNKIEMSKILLGGEGNLTFSPEDAWAEDERRMNAMNNISGYWQHLKDDITAYDPPGPTTMPECTFTTPDEDEAWQAAEKRMDAIGHNGGTGEHYEAKSLEERYPQYYKSVRHLEFVDVYRVHTLFAIEDCSGCIQHASKKLLLSGSRTGGKAKRQDIEEARDTLTRWLEMEKGR